VSDFVTQNQIKSNVSLTEQLSDRNCKQICIDKIQDDTIRYDRRV